MRTILGTPAAPDLARVISTLSLLVGGLGLASAQRSRGGAHWASWADCIRMVKERHPTIAETMITHMADGTAPCFEAVRACEQSLVTAGLEIPSWRELAETPPERVAEPEPNQPKFGWQQKATQQLQQQYIREEVWPELGDPARALLRSQHGPLASAPLTALPTSRATRIDAQPFRLRVGDSTSPSLDSTHLPMWPPT